MRNLLLLTTILLTLSIAPTCATWAQKKSSNINLYLGGGVNLAKAEVAGYYDMSSQSTSRFSFGFFADKIVKGNWAIRTGLFYNGLGQQYSENDKTQQDEFNYFTVPVQAKISFKESPFSLYAGPQFSYLLNATWKPDADTKLLMTEKFQRLNVSAAGGIICAFTKRFSMAFEYQSSLGSTLDKLYADNLPDGTSYQPNAFSLRAFVKLSK